MKAARRQKIRELLRTKPFVSLKELTEMFPDVTSMTLRRDIEYFEEQGELIKVRNGARSMKFITATTDENYDRREKENEDVKHSLALAAVAYLEKGKCVFIDSGSTAMQIASVMPDEVYYIVTSGPNVSLKTAEKSKPIVSVIGGILNRDSISLIGDTALSVIENTDIDIAFIVPSGYTPGEGFTCGNYSECELKSAIVRKAKKVILLIDSSKFDKKFPYAFCDFSDIDVFITDTEFPKYSNIARESGAVVIITGKPRLREHVTKCLPIEI